MQLDWEREPPPPDRVGQAWHPAIAVEQQAKPWIRGVGSQTRFIIVPMLSLRSSLVLRAWGTALWQQIVSCAQVSTQWRRAEAVLLWKPKGGTRPIS